MAGGRSSLRLRDPTLSHNRCVRLHAGAYMLEMLSAEWWRKAWPLAMQPAIRNRAIKVALFIGTVLTIFNQYDAILAGHFPDLLKMSLTFCVPYLVNTHGAVTARLSK